jgi:hypothetical protein
MVKVNNIDVVDRHNRPSVNTKVLLRAFFINNGEFQDPIDISGVTIFAAATNQSPSSVLNSSGLIDYDNISDQVLMSFGPSAAESDYVPSPIASSTYRLGTGEYGVILDGTIDLSGHVPDTPDGFEGFRVANSATSSIDYIDVWTVKMQEGGNYKTIIQDFTLNDNTFFTTTQPILFSAKSKLRNKRIVYGSKVDLTIGTEVNINNTDIDQSIKNIFANSVVNDAAIEITKLNDANGLSSRFSVSSFDDTEDLVDVTSDNTLVLNWDTTNIASIAAANETFGGIKGSYEVRAKYTILNQVIKSPPMFLEIR